MNKLTLKEKLKIALKALKTAHENACSCCASNTLVEKHCNKAINKITKKAKVLNKITDKLSRG